MTLPYPPPQPQRTPPPALKAKRRVWPWVFGGVVAMAVIASTALSGDETTSARMTPTLNASPPPPGVPSGVDPTKYTPAAPVVPAVPVDPGPAQKITAREWQLIAKNPSAHVGKRVIVYGQVTQFDAATGTQGFRANVDGIEQKPRYGWADYETNTILGGDPTILSEVVQDDLFKAEATVVGAYTYETTLGGQLTAPQLQVTKITVIGSV